MDNKYRSRRFALAVAALSVGGVSTLLGGVTAYQASDTGSRCATGCRRCRCSC
jgi:hypothetical protein